MTRTVRSRMRRAYALAILTGALSGAGILLAGHAAAQPLRAFPESPLWRSAPALQVRLAPGQSARVPAFSDAAVYARVRGRYVRLCEGYGPYRARGYGAAVAARGTRLTNIGARVVRVLIWADR